MLSGSDGSEVFELLESTSASGAELNQLYAAVREPTLTRALLAYHTRTGSTRALDVLARAPEPHARHLLDALLDELHAAPRRALHALAPLLARRPVWLPRLASHPLLPAIGRAAKLHAPLHALLALAVLLPSAPHTATSLLPDISSALLLALNRNDPHTQLAAHALFHALYAIQPCALADALRSELHTREPAVRERLERALMPLLKTARLHPHLVLGSRRLDPHDEPSECRRYELEPCLPPADPPPTPQPPPPPPPVPVVTRATAALRPGVEPWFMLGERCGADSAPHTPLPAGEGGSPPEAAVEATPENTPAKEPRAQFQFPSETSTAVRALGRLSQPPSPLRKESSPAADACGGRLARVVLDRTRAEAASPVPFCGAPPTAAARPLPERAHALDFDALEDREVLELTANATGDAPRRDEWPEPEAPPLLQPPRASRVSRPRAARAPPPPAPSPRRAASCPPRAHFSRRDSAVQTVDTQPPEYEFVIADFYRAMNEDSIRQVNEERSQTVCPSARLDAYLAKLYSGECSATNAELAEQLALTHAQLMYERWRREAHAERNRRLLGRCRQARQAELHNQALRDRVRALTRELDEVRGRIPTVTSVPEFETATLAALASERSAREKAVALLHECEEQRASDALELQRARGEAQEATRRGDALARAAALADRRTEEVERLRRELLILGERVARAPAAAAAAEARGVAGGAREARAARREAAAARGDADAAAARAEAALARAHELETTLTLKESALAELKRAARDASEEHAARLDALQDKYRALMHVLRRMETRRLESLAGAIGSVGGSVSPHSSPLSSSLASAVSEGKSKPGMAECSRVRHLLDDDSPVNTH